MKRALSLAQRIAGSRILTTSTEREALKLFAATAMLCLFCSGILMAADDEGAFLPAPVRPVSTVPANGDQNPYGVAFVPPGFPAGGPLNPGDILVSNFNNAGSAPVQSMPTGASWAAPNSKQAHIF